MKSTYTIKWKKGLLQLWNNGTHIPKLNKYKLNFVWGSCYLAYGVTSWRCIVYLQLCVKQTKQIHLKKLRIINGSFSEKSVMNRVYADLKKTTPIMPSSRKDLLIYLKQNGQKQTFEHRRSLLQLLAMWPSGLNKVHKSSTLPGRVKTIVT